MADDLGSVLEEVPLPESGHRREAVIALALEKSGSTAGAPADGRSGSRSRRTWLAGGIAAGCLAAVVGLTPSGRAVAEDLGRLVGIGEPSSLDQSNASELPASGPGVVLANGTLPGTDEPYEIVGYSSDEATGQERAAEGPWSCLNFDLPGLEKNAEADYNRTCINRPQRRPLSTSGFSDSGEMYGPEARYSVGGLVSAEVARVEVSYLDESGVRQQAPVALGLLKDDLAAEVGAPFEVGSFHAFIPDDGMPSGGASPSLPSFMESVEVRAFDDGGTQLAFEAYGRELSERIAEASAASQAEAAIDNTLTHLLAALQKARTGTLRADVDRRESIDVLEAIISLHGGGELTPAEARAIGGGRANELLDAPREAGDFPEDTAEPPPDLALEDVLRLEGVDKDVIKRHSK